MSATRGVVVHFEAAYATLNVLFAKMGIPPAQPPVAMPEFALAEGVDVDTLDDVEVNGDDVLRVGRKPVFVHLGDTPSGSSAGAPRVVHFMPCRKFVEMQNKGHGERYRITQRTDARFKLRLAGGGEIVCRLKACRWCLSLSNWRGYRSLPQHKQVRMAADFDYAGFMDEKLAEPVSRYRPALSEDSLSALGITRR